MEQEQTNSRMIHYDLLRIIAAFSVVMLHCAAQFWYVLPVTGTEWKIANAYDAMFRFGVPIFVMISGVLFLGRDVEIKKLYSHNILRLVSVYLVWSVIYGLYDCRNYTPDEMSWDAFVLESFNGRYHLWFIPMLVGIYILLPVLSSWVRNAERRNLEYFLLVFVILQICRETVTILWQNDKIAFVSAFFDNSTLSMACSYVGYFILGHYLVRYGIPTKLHKWFYLAVIPCWVINWLLDNRMAYKTGVPVGAIYDSFGLFTFITVVALFLFFTSVVSKIRYTKRAVGLIQEVSRSTLGIYLAHLLVLEYLQTQNIHTMSMPIIWGIPMITVIVFVVCGILASLLRRVPVVGKYIC